MSYQVGISKTITVVKCACGDPICGTYGLSEGSFNQGCGWNKEAAERFAVCWNAFRDVPTDQITSVGPDYVGLLRLNTDLLTALKGLRDEAKDWQDALNGERPSLDDAMKAADAAIAKAQAARDA